MTTKMSAAETSRLVKKQLKHAFPRIENLSVRCKNFSLRIEWTNGPSVVAVERATAQYAGATMVQNGGDMIKAYSTSQDIDYGIDFVFCTRTLSESVEACVQQYVKQHYAADTSINQVATQRRVWEITQHVDVQQVYQDGQWKTQDGQPI